MRKTVLLHPGFHKTGTTTLQRGLWCRREALQGQLDMIMLKDIRLVSLSSRACSIDPTPGKLANLTGSMAQVLAGKDPLDPRPLVISSEALAGQIPGRNGFQSYTHAPLLLDKLIRAIHDHYRGEVDIIVWFTTRASEPWRRSVYYQNVRTIRLTDSYDAFASKLAAVPSLAEIVARVDAHLGRRALVVSSSLEAAQGRTLGLMGELFDMLGIVWRDPTPPVHQNAQCAVLLEAFLKLNRSALSDAEVSAAKNELLARHRKRMRRQAMSHKTGLRPEIPGPWALAARSPGRWSDGPYR